MKMRILFSAVIGATFAVVLYPAESITDKLVVLSVSFFLLLGILFCTILLIDEKKPTPTPGVERPIKEATGHDEDGGIVTDGK